MSGSSYEKLGVSEGASFEEIQNARTRLVEELAGDQRKISEIEAAYDAVLMDRLRLRQEGKIKVPEGIRFPEKAPQAATLQAPAPTKPSPQWLQKLVDTPSSVDIALPGGVLALMGAAVYFYPQDSVLQVAMAIATGSTLYFLYRKEQKLGRAVLLGVGGLVLGFAIGGVLYGLIRSHVPGLPRDDVFISLVTFLILWLFSSFTK
jgi:hypothetical protein